MIAAPLAMLVAIRPLLAGAAGRAPRPRRRSAPRVAWAALAVAFVGGAALLELPRPARRAGRPARARLRAAAPSCRSCTASRSSTRARTATPPTSCSAPTPTCRWSSSPTRRSRPNPEKPFDTGDAYSPIDFDSFSRATLDRFPYVITGRAAWNSEAPPSFRRDRRDPLLRALGSGPATPPRDRHVLLEGTEAGGARRLRLAGDPRSSLANPGRASLFPDAVIGHERRLDAGQRARHRRARPRRRCDLPAGTLEPLAPVLLPLRPDPRARRASAQPLKAALDGQRPNTISLANNGQFWPAGEIRERRRAGPSSRSRPPSRAASRASPATTARPTIGELVAVRDEPHRIVPLGAGLRRAGSTGTKSRRSALGASGG